MKLSILILLLFSFQNSLFSQSLIWKDVKNKPVIFFGIDYCNFNTTKNYRLYFINENPSEIENAIGYKIGLNYTQPLNDKLSLEYGIHYISFKVKGYDTEWDGMYDPWMDKRSYEYKITLQYITIPFNLVYDFNFSGNNIYFSSGTFVGFTFKNKVKEIEDVESIHMTNGTTTYIQQNTSRNTKSFPIDTKIDNCGFFILGFHFGMGYKFKLNNSNFILIEPNISILGSIKALIKYKFGFPYSTIGVKTGFKF